MGYTVGNHVLRLSSCVAVKVNFRQMSFIHQLSILYNCGSGKTVNLKIFARVLFSRNFTGVEFHLNKSLAKWRKHSFIY